jgi:glucose-1-phosphate cytidylyltransferase
MKAVLLAGGLGTRLSEETAVRPKPMVEIGGRPILWHIMKIYAAHGVTEFIVCLGYKGYVIKEYFANYFLHSSDVTFKLASNEMVLHRAAAEPWTVTLIETGEETQIGGRGRLATVTAVRPPGRFGAILFEGDKVTGFQEKPRGDGGWINGGFFVCSPKVGEYIEGDDTVWEREPMERLAAEGELGAYFHEGFWQPMDTLRDRNQLEKLWATGKAPWRTWS